MGKRLSESVFVHGDILALRQCDQMLEKWVAQIISNVAQKVATDGLNEQ